MDFNGFFNPFANAQNHPFNPFNPNFGNNINQTIQNSMPQGFNPFGMFGQSQGQNQPQTQNYQQDNPNIHVNNHWNIGNNYYGAPEYDDSRNYPHNVRQNQEQPTHGFYSQSEPPKQQTKLFEKELKILEAEKNPNSGHYYKKIGNDYYKKGQYAQAIENYTKAIQINDSESVFYSNRARCYKQLKKFDKAYEDAKIAVELDDKNIKGYLLCGQILVEMGKIEHGFDKLNRALNRMTKALSLCAGQGKQDFEKDVEKNIARVKKVIFLKQESINKQKKVEGLKFIKELIYSDSNISEQEKHDKYDEIFKSIGDPLAPTIRDVPDHLCCKITMDLMEDPVITQAGITYERAALNAHIQKNGNTDPVTREAINPSYIFPNVALKQATSNFIRDNPWAFESQYGDNYLDIKF